MNENSEDMALNALLASAAIIAPNISQEIVRQAYAIEKDHQFDAAREMPLRSLQKLIEEIVATGVSL